MASKGMVQKVLALAALASVVLGVSGCGYLKNVRDDVMDLGELSVGVNLPRVGGEVTAFRPPIGAYVEATDFLHFGGISRAGADLEWDRRGLGILGDSRKKIGFGPWRSVQIKQTPWVTNGYKRTGSKLDGWRGHMRSMSLAGAPATELVFTGAKSPFFYKGWHNAAHFSVEGSLYEPLVSRVGLYARIGLDPGQAADLVLSVVLLDLWGDDAFKFWSGEPKY